MILKFIFVVIIPIIIVGAIGYWAQSNGVTFL